MLPHHVAMMQLHLWHIVITLVEKIPDCKSVTNPQQCTSGERQTNHTAMHDVAGSVCMLAVHATEVSSQAGCGKLTLCEHPVGGARLDRVLAEWC